MTNTLNKKWYKKGLRFACTECGKCCTGGPGYVWVKLEEIEQMAKAVGISCEEFLKKYTRQIGGRLSLKEDPRTYDCVFLKEGKKCALYTSRPKQCRTFPFWKENVSSKKAWEETARRCEGIDHPDAPLIPLHVIQENLEESQRDNKQGE